MTRKVSLADANWIASAKGLVAAPVNLALTFALGTHLPPWPQVDGAMAVGLLAYGVSLALFVVGLCHLGTARTAPTSRWHRSWVRCWRSSWASRSHRHCCWPASARALASGCT